MKAIALLGLTLVVLLLAQPPAYAQPKPRPTRQQALQDLGSADVETRRLAAAW